MAAPHTLPHSSSISQISKLGVLTLYGYGNVSGYALTSQNYSIHVNQASVTQSLAKNRDFTH